uniref:Uncharacterized protein n=1 Tax=Anguilla anguilla TaxID=7936 RepID=A0A0E9VLB3_ANGAN
MCQCLYYRLWWLNMLNLGVSPAD